MKRRPGGRESERRKTEERKIKRGERERKVIESVIEGIGAALRREFGEGYEIWTEENGRDLKKPCFYIQCQRLSCRLFRGQRYFREQRFRIRYFPVSEEDGNRECYGVAERMNQCLERIAVQGGMSGTKTEAWLAEGTLDYYVNYDCFICKKEDGEAMGEWQAHVKVREGNS